MMTRTNKGVDLLCQAHQEANIDHQDAPTMKQGVDPLNTQACIKGVDPLSDATTKRVDPLKVTTTITKDLKEDRPEVGIDHLVAGVEAEVPTSHQGTSEKKSTIAKLTSEEKSTTAKPLEMRCI